MVHVVSASILCVAPNSGMDVNESASTSFTHTHTCTHTHMHTHTHRLPIESGSVVQSFPSYCQRLKSSLP